MLKRPVILLLAVALGLAVGAGFLMYREIGRHADAHARMQLLPSTRLRHLLRGARAYQAEHERLPASAPLTPPLGSCCPSRTCASDPQRWATPAWQALGFAVPEPHAYSYEWIVDASGAFTARALGDLDCDGTYATFELLGSLAPGAAETVRQSRLEDE